MKRKREFGGKPERGKRETSQGSRANGKSPGLPVSTGTFLCLDTVLLFTQSCKRDYKPSKLPFSAAWGQSTSMIGTN